MNDVTFTFDASPSGNVTNYPVTWTQNGTALPVVNIPRSAAQDASGYSVDFTTSTGVTPNPGDVIGASVTATDTPDNLSSTPLIPTPATVTIPTTPIAPQPPTNGVLTLT